MLTRLRVNNLALVDDITLEFGEGFNVITGETGAGKSVLIGALNLLTGKRADKSAIREESKSATAEAEFHLSDAETVSGFLEERGLDPLENGQLIVRRVLKSKGSASSLINDQSVTTAALRDLGDLLLDLHGPHDHQSLFQPSVQRDILDDFGKHWKERKAYEDIYQSILKTREEIATLEAADEDASQLDLLNYRIQELEEADLKEGEEEDIEKEHSVSGHAVEVQEIAGRLNQLFSSGEICALDVLGQGLAQLGALQKLYPEAEHWYSELNALIDNLNTLSHDVDQSLSSLDADPARMEELDQRLSLYRSLKRKYRRTVPELLTWLEESREMREALEHRDERLAELRAKRSRTEAEARSAGRKLSRLRQKSGEKLAKAMTAEIQALGFENGQFAVHVEEGDLGHHGLDKIDYGFAPNVGEPMRSLKQIASSGEMSRVLLAVKSVLARHDKVPVLVFDEIDANVGGEIGSAVGRKLKEVAGYHQVICITHLPQVAIFGNRHYAISKSVKQDRTLTEAARLTEEDRIAEVARMLGGTSISNATVDHARQLLEQGV